MPGEIIVLITCSQAQSEELAGILVEERLAACVNIINQVRSIYVWEGKVCKEEEQLLIVKTNTSVWQQLCARVKQVHSYDLPEIVSVKLLDGDQPYMNWLNSAVGTVV